MSVPTPHIRALEGDFAKTVLMPGDPLRAKYIAETFLEDARLVTDVRNMLGFTGTYHGKPVSVMGAGMGIPSIGIYSMELYRFYGVETILRVGSAGSMREDVKVMDLVLAQGACTDSNWGAQYRLRGTFAPIADFGLLRRAVEIAEGLGIRTRVGNVLSADAFYDDQEDFNAGWRKMGVLAVEMEAAGLYMNAARCGKKALALLTISDELLTGIALPAEQRQTSFREMMEVALELA
ncbi:MAG: purine-nucleoside phosphorylase [Lachnospiraceae bacterium]|nr:purine-nucleoside phosphorylase [Lachnospiraceae bacterium]